MSMAMEPLVGAPVEKRGVVALRAILALASVNACVLAVVAVASSTGWVEFARTALAGAAAVGLSVVPFRSAATIVSEQMTEDGHWRWLPLFAALSATVLVAGGPASDLLFPAVLTPLGVAVLLGDRRGAAVACALIAIGFAAATLEPGASRSPTTALDNVAPVLAIVAVGLVPVKFAEAAVRNSPRDVSNLRLQATASRWANAQRDPDTRPAEPQMPPRLPSKPTRVISRHDNEARIAERLRAGQSVDAIAAELNLSTQRVENAALTRATEEGVRRWLRSGYTDARIALELADLKLNAEQVRYRRRQLQRELGARSRAEAIEILNAVDPSDPKHPGQAP